MTTTRETFRQVAARSMHTAEAAVDHAVEGLMEFVGFLLHHGREILGRHAASLCSCRIVSLNRKKRPHLDRAQIRSH